MKSDYTYQFKGVITTDFKGYSELLRFYNFCLSKRNCTIELDWNSLEMLDANLCALLCAMIHKLKKENNLIFYLDVSILKGGLSVFWRNGFANFILKRKDNIEDDRKSTIKLKAFRIDSFDGYCDYIEKDLLQHRGIDSMKFKDKNKVKDSYLELFNNYEIHAETKEPILCCGQFFPSSGELKFTLVDMGCGFLKKIAEKTKDDDKILEAAKAIQWAIKGGTTKKEAKGGTGLKKMLFYCMSGNSSMHIITDNCYWMYDGSITNFKIEQPFTGTTIHLIMRYI